MAGSYSRSGSTNAPHPVPTIARSTLKAPIHNPYDKFSQAEFDAWIGDITGALRRALGQEEPIPKPTRDTVKAEDSVYDEVGEDSFAELKARRAAKGKQRATYEDLADDDELDDREVETSILAPSEEEEEEDSSEYDSGGQWADVNGNWSHGEDEVSAGDSEGEYDERAGNSDEPIEISDDDDEDEEVVAAGEVGDEETGEEYDEDEESSAQEALPWVPSLETYDEEDEDEEQDEEQDAEPTEDLEEGEEEDEIQETQDDEVIQVGSDEDDEEFPPKSLTDIHAPPVDIPDPWEGPSTYAEDFYSGGDVLTGATDAHVLPAERQGEAFDSEQSQDDLVPEEEQSVEEPPPVQLVDKWEGPRLYAEDYYAGGDMPLADASLHTPSHLTPASTPDAINGFLSPGVLTPESPPVDRDALDSYDAPETTPADEVPTFSMPSEPTVRSGAEEIPDVDELYMDLRSEPLPEAINVSAPTPDILKSVKEDITPELHDRAADFPQVSPRGHLDWNYPPAFPSGRPAPVAGHPTALSGVAASQSQVLDPNEQPHTVHEIFDISDDEDEPEAVGPLPLGTSDLEIPADASYDEEEGPEEREEGDIQSLPQEFPKDIVDMFKVDELGTNDFLEAPTGQPDNEAQFSYNEFASLYTNDESFNGFEGDESANLIEEHLEPIALEDTDFGNLPTPHGTSRTGSFNAAAVTDFYEVFSQVEAEQRSLASAEDAPIEPLPTDAPSSQPEESFMDISQEETVDQPAVGDVFDVAIEEVKETVIEITTEVGVVEEAEDEGDMRAQSVVSDGFEVATHRGETPAVDAEFSVEEAVTEGRLTAEPEEAQHGRELSLVVEPVQKSLSEETLEHGAVEVDSSAIEGETTVSLSADSSPHPQTDRTDVEQATDTPSNVTDSLQSTANATTDQEPQAEASVPVPTVEVEEIALENHAITPLEDLHPLKLEYSPRMLEPGIPMPVSADPSVPDPASMHASPSDSPRSTSPQAEDQRLSSRTARSSVPPALLQQLARSSGISGLFTPYSQASTGPPSPELTDIIDDAAAAEKDEDAESPSIIMSAGLSTEAVHGGEHDVDLDADGDVDPDYEEDSHESQAASENDTPEAPPVTDGHDAIECPFALPADHSTLDADALAAHPSTDLAEEPQVVSQAVEQPQPEEKETSERVSMEPLHTPAASDAEAAGASVDTALEQSEAADVVPPIPPTPARKRKRVVSAPTTRMTRSRSNNAPPPPIPVTQARSAKSRGKQKAVTPEPLSDVEFEGEPSKEATPSGKGQMSVNVSRESSVLSNTPSTFASPTPSSPITAITRQSTLLAAAFQNDGFLRHHHGPLPPLSPRTQLAPALVPEVVVPLVESPKSRSPSPVPIEEPVQGARPAADIVSEALPRADGDAAEDMPVSETEPDRRQDPEPNRESDSERTNDVEAPSAEQALPDASPSIAAPSAPAPTVPTPISSIPTPSSSITPVTRSHCRYHKVSMPGVTSGSRMSFVVPGCCLSNLELMREQDVNDEGDLTYDEIHRLRSDVESLDLDLNVVGVVRKLIGSPIEGEAYYLPQPHERVRMRSNRKQPRLSNVENISVRNGISARQRASSRKSPGASTSASVSVTASPARSRMSVGSSFAGESISDEESDTASQPATKRRRRVKTAPAAPGSSTAAAENKPQGSKIPVRKPRANDSRSKARVTPVTEPTTPTEKPEDKPEDQAGAIKKRPLRRRIARDAAAYKPEDDASGQDFQPEAEKGKTTRKKAGARPRGLKRSRDSDVAQKTERPKRQKMK